MQETNGTRVMSNQEQVAVARVCKPETDDPWAETPRGKAYGEYERALRCDSRELRSELRPDVDALVGKEVYAFLVSVESQDVTGQGGRDAHDRVWDRIRAEMAAEAA